MTREARAVLVTAALLAAAPAGEALAADDDRALRKHNEAMLLWDLGMYGEGIATLAQGYKLHPHARSFVINTALMYRRAGELELRLDNPVLARRWFAVAADVVDHYIHLFPLGDPRRAREEETWTDLNARVEALRPADPKATEPTTSSKPADDGEVDREVDRRLDEIARKDSEAAAAEVEKVRGFRLKLGGGLTGGGFALAATGVGLLMKMISVSGEMKVLDVTTGADAALAMVPTRDAYLATGTTALVLGLGAMTTGIIYLALPVKRRPHLKPAGCGIELQGRF